MATRATAPHLSPEERRALVEASPASLAEALSGGRWMAAPHHELLAARLVDVAAGRTRRLLVTMPPRHGKSYLVSVWFLVWWLNLRPSARIILASYEATFAASWGRLVRNLVREHADSLRVRLAPDSSASNRWHTSADGHMVTAGVGGAITGRGADLLIIDDPIKNWQEAHSATRRQAVWEWWLSTARTRLQPGGAVIIVLTRWHMDDLAGRLLSQDAEGRGERWEVVNLPALAEPGDLLGREPGTALWPEMYPAAALEQTRQEVGPYVWEALYQQRPAAPGGSIYLREWFGEAARYRPDGAQSPVVARYMSCDTALKDAEDNAYTAVVVGELLADYRLRIRSVFRARLQFPALTGTIEALAGEWGRDGKLRAVIIEDKASGTSALQSLRLQAPRELRKLLVPFQPTGDKPTRAQQAAAWCANGSVQLPSPGDDVPWLHDFEAELFEFPHGRFADQADAFAQLILYLEHLLAEGRRARVAASEARAEW